MIHNMNISNITVDDPWYQMSKVECQMSIRKYTFLSIHISLSAWLKLAVPFAQVKLTSLPLRLIVIPYTWLRTGHYIVVVLHYAPLSPVRILVTACSLMTGRLVRCCHLLKYTHTQTIPIPLISTYTFYHFLPPQSSITSIPTNPQTHITKSHPPSPHFVSIYFILTPYFYPTHLLTYYNI